MADHRNSKKTEKRKEEPFLKKAGEERALTLPKVKSICDIHEKCGGCSYLEISYDSELKLKKQLLEQLWVRDYEGERPPWLSVVASPHEYEHRSKLSLQLKHMRDGSMAIGTSPFGSKEVIPFSRCAVVMSGIEEKFPAIYTELKHRDLTGIKRACIVVREGQDGKVDWGGLGRGSLKRNLDHAMVFRYNGREVRYDLNCFFQSNLSILPKLFNEIERSLELDESSTFVDFYGGVGLFSIMVGHRAKSIKLIEENPDSLVFAGHNKELNGLEKMEILKGRMESFVDKLNEGDGRWVGVIDPPRSGMTEEVRRALIGATQLKKLAYLSCNPESQLRDLKDLCGSDAWKITKLVPFDFFPKSYHIESLAILERRN